MTIIFYTFGKFIKCMTLETYLLFVGASIVLCIVPGPDMIFLLGRTIAQGRKAGIIAALGINTGAYVHLLAAALGISAILATSALAFTLLKWIGAAYLIYLGVRILISKQSALVIDSEKNSVTKNSSIFWQGFLSDVLNPKVAIFFLAFLPQFVEAHSPNRLLHIILLGCTVNVIAIIINVVLVLLAGMLTLKLRQNKKLSVWLNKILGGVFVALGLQLAKEKL